MYKKVEVEIGGKQVTFETGKLAKQTDGSVVVTSGDTMVLVTAVAEKKSKNRHQSGFYGVPHPTTVAPSRCK